MGVYLICVVLGDNLAPDSESGGILEIGRNRIVGKLQLGSDKAAVATLVGPSPHI